MVVNRPTDLLPQGLPYPAAPPAYDGVRGGSRGRARAVGRAALDHDVDSRPATQLAAIQDDITRAQRGLSFLSPSALQAGQRWMLDRLAHVPAARKLYDEQQQQQKRAKASRTACSDTAPQLSCDASSSSSSSGSEASLEAAVRTVLRIPASLPVTYRSPDQKRALTAVVQGVSPLIVVLPTGGGKTLLPLAAAVLDGQQQRDQPSVTILVLPFRALIEDLQAYGARN